MLRLLASNGPKSSSSPLLATLHTARSCEQCIAVQRKVWFIFGGRRVWSVILSCGDVQGTGRIGPVGTGRNPVSTNSGKFIRKIKLVFFAVVVFFSSQNIRSHLP